jgi:DNA-directed RNA polymerase specialized sigma24 family protein
MPHKQPIGNTQQHSERQLLLRVADGDRAAFATLYQQHLPILYQYVYRFSKQSKTTTDEIVQEVFITIWEKKP